MMVRALFLVLVMATCSFAAELTLEKAVERTLVLQADILYSKLSADSSKSAAHGAAGAFDPALSASVYYQDARSPFEALQKQAYGLDYKKSRTQGYSLSLSALTRSGISLETTASVDDDQDLNLYFIDESTASLGVSLTFPLMDFFMENTYTTTEKMYREYSESSLEDYFYQAASSIYTTVAAYWGYLAAHEQLLIYQSSEKNIRKMYSDFEKLIKAKQRPRTDINHIKANLAVKQGQVISAKKNLTTKSFNLAKAMGVAIEDANLSFPASHWVSVDQGKIPDLRMCIELAHTNRFDIKSMKSKIRAAELSVSAAKRVTKPNVDVFVSADYSDIDERLPTEPSDYDRTLSAGISFSTPLGNRSAKSAMVQEEIALRQLKLSLAEIKRTVSMDVATALNDLNQSIKAYEYDLLSVQLYKETLEVEEKKLKLGMSTVLDVIDTRENYQTALISKIDGLYQVAVALANVVHVTGDIMKVEGETIRVNMPPLYSLSLIASKSEQSAGQNKN